MANKTAGSGKSRAVKKMNAQKMVKEMEQKAGIKNGVPGMREPKRGMVAKAKKKARKGKVA